MAQLVTTQQLYKEYLQELYQTKVNRGDLREVALAWGRNEKESKEDFRKVSNLFDAVQLLIKKAAQEIWPNAESSK